MGFIYQTCMFWQTSRKEGGFKMALTPILSHDPIGIRNTNVDADVRTFTRAQLLSDPPLKDWPQPIRDKVEQKLVGGSFGV
jgi:hypothetical protein